MKHSIRSLVGSCCVLLLIFSAVSFMAQSGPAQTESAAEDESAAGEESAAEPAPPAGQTYIGVKKCASCHFDQYLVWKGDKHAKAFDVLPAKYKNDESCLKCHTTGFGKPTGYQKSSDTHLAGVSCETCHGPGSKHEEVCKPFANATKLSADQEKVARDSIYHMLPHNVCATCHLAKAHKKHPPYDK